LGDTGYSEDCAWCIFGCGCSYQVDHVLEVAANVSSAVLTLAQTKGATLLSASRAISPADRTVSARRASTWWVAESATELLTILARERRAGSAAVGPLLAGDADVVHARRTVWRADVATGRMEVCSTLRVPETQTLFRIVERRNLANSTAVSRRLCTVGAIVAEAAWAGLPAHWAVADVARCALGVAESPTLLFASGARRDGFASTTPVSSQPAGRSV